MPTIDSGSEIRASLSQQGAAALSCRDFDLEACCRYVCSRQTSEGGFCFYAYPQWGVEEPNTPDTHAAVQIFDLLGIATPNIEQCKAWLVEQQDVSGSFQTAVIGYAALKALCALRAKPRHCPHQFLYKMAEALHVAEPPPQQPDGWLLSALHCIELWQSFDLGVGESMRKGIALSLDRLRHVDGGFGSPASNLPETAAALRLGKAVGLSIGDEVLAYARGCEGPPLGFNITPNAISSSLETQLAGLQVLRHFSAPPQSAAFIREFAKSCQTSSGGFGRAPGAIARLDDTLRALQIFVMLRGAEAEEERRDHRSSKS